MARRKILAPKSLGEVLHELGHLYRDSRRGLIDPADASRLTTVLNAIRSALEAHDLEDRIKALEERKHGT